MMDYSDFDVEDFQADDSFVAYVLGKDPDARKFWEDYVRRNPAQREKIEWARLSLLQIRNAERLEYPSHRVDDLWNRIDDSISANQPVRGRSTRWSMLWRIAAAVSAIVILAFAAFHVIETMDKREQVALFSDPESGYIEEVNDTGRELKIHLSDGTIVTLARLSRIRYPRHFADNKNRDVVLEGEAFFDVAKNPKQPFLVHTREVTTKVLGTSFNVKAYEGDKDIVVSVTEGKVSVFASADAKKNLAVDPEVNGVVLTPNQRVTYVKAERSFNKAIVEEPVKLVPEAAQFDFTFENAPLKKVFESLETAYGVEIIFDEDIMQNCFLTVPLGDEPLFEKLKIICRTVNASYEIIDATVVIDGKGC